ncbi:hypothetical protein COT75_00590 [Candidatus Beckwithbacteria bacterium CG10_big_fil_rev_8_21_14_0_10_34_10]|uniref:General secretion pathway GspH domain-containing protein n=1 Tax=Candidatus Beckwithbacteria bacterium CG10_big_fil_rev_8_21_14_0_10_34_10 TaxID=1974495 RepID=A0A2H0WAI5_9BACT|nr:MAG: hypothetical protein COT75_00590 [Candidatus Beckwithbacteria bacterium CG10_big_fil_rev_8_21_14_0_10_34_10]
MKVTFFRKRIPLFLIGSAGFSLVEILVVISLMAVVFTIGTNYYKRFNEKREVEKVVEVLTNYLHQASANANNNVKDCTDSLCGGTDLLCDTADDSPEVNGLDAWIVNINNRTIYWRCGGIDQTDNIKSFSSEIPASVTIVSIPDPVEFQTLGGTVTAATITINGSNPADSSSLQIRSSGLIKRS